MPAFLPPPILYRVSKRKEDRWTKRFLKERKTLLASKNPPKGFWHVESLLETDYRGISWFQMLQKNAGIEYQCIPDNPQRMTNGVILKRRGKKLFVGNLHRQEIHIITVLHASTGWQKYDRELGERQRRKFVSEHKNNCKIVEFMKIADRIRNDWRWSETEFSVSIDDVMTNQLGLSAKEKEIAYQYLKLAQRARPIRFSNYAGT